MAGIGKITQRRKDTVSNFTGGREVFLRDGDQVLMSIVPTGDDGDERLTDFWRHAVQSQSSDGATRWTYSLCGKSVDNYCDVCASGQRSQHRFALWVYVYHILHSEKNNDSWTEIKSKAGSDSQYKEDVNGFRMFSQGFGQRDYLWNQVVDIYEENGNLNDKVVRVRRRGSGMQDTNYSIQVTNTATEIPDESKEELDGLGNAINFFIEREENSSASNNNGTGKSTATKSVPLDDDSSVTESTIDTLDALFDKETLF
tara:strand:+ start:1082 stop:1852 length:771 start_codon:yes stop_codon:yes gene_type:complete